MSNDEMKNLRLAIELDRLELDKRQLTAKIRARQKFPMNREKQIENTIDKEVLEQINRDIKLRNK